MGAGGGGEGEGRKEEQEAKSLMELCLSFALTDFTKKESGNRKNLGGKKTPQINLNFPPFYFL